MSLRCRQGDKAVILRGQHIGYVVTLVDFLGNVSVPDLCGKMYPLRDAWEVSCPQFLINGERVTVAIKDQDLHPISPYRSRTGIMDCGR